MTLTNIVLVGASVFNGEEACETGDRDIDAGLDAEWRACTLTLRMMVQSSEVPTMNEIGLISFAAFAGLAGIWFIRRRQIST